MADNVTERAAKAAGMISALFLVSRILGFIRENLSGRLFNRFETDAFIAAFIIPDTMYYLLVGGALSAAFIPIFTEYLAKGDEEEGWKVASTFINITALLLIIFTVFGMIFARGVALWEAPSFPEDKMLLLVKLTRVMFPAVCFTALAGLIGGVLNSYRHFLAPALGPVFYNIAIISGAFWLGPRRGIMGMAAGVVGGAVGNFLIQILFLRKVGGRQFRFAYIDLNNSGFRRMLRLMVPALVGLSATQANLWITNVMASSLPEGSITALRFANRLIQLPIGIFAAGIAMAFFPLLSGLVAEKKMNSFKDTLSLSLRSIFFLMLPAAIGLMVLREPIIKFLFEGQKFTSRDTALTAYALFFYSTALFAHAAILMLPRAFYALQDTVTPVLVSVFSVLTSIALNWIFLKYTGLGVGGFALSFSIMGLINMLFLMEILRRKIGGIRGYGIVKSFIKAMAASLIMGAAVSLIMKFSAYVSGGIGLTGHWEAALTVVLGMAVGMAAYFGTAWFLKMDELAMVIRLVKGKLLSRKVG
ncbi:MAG: murein biosynthesis integral membrane protein MurJ [Firmicutes bacterium]|nr:murein biosynthesis integral membrane protein MurJ [Bacillota bacterium]